MSAVQRKRAKPRDESEKVFARVPVDLVRSLDRIADSEMVSRSAALRLLLRRGLATTPKRYFTS